MISKTIRLTIARVALVVGLISCGSKESAAVRVTFASEFHITNDDGDALAGAVIVASGTRLGTTGADGILRTNLAGTEGQSLPVTVSCPLGFSGAEKPSILRLTHTRRVNFSDRPMRVEAVCLRNVRSIVLVLRALGGAELPLQVDGKPAGTTDADGIAHVLVKVERNVKALNVSLDTSGRQELRPKNPSRTYELGGNDGLLVFDQTLVATPKPKPHRGGTKSRNRIPYRVK
jgi:hypothetical protein